MSQTIPTLLDEPFYTIRARLEDRDYTLKFRYSTRQARYYLSIYDEDETPLVVGLKLVTNLALLRFYHHRPNMPPGELMVTCMTADVRPPEFGELGADQRCQLTYFTHAEVAELVAAAQAAD